MYSPRFSSFILFGDLIFDNQWKHQELNWNNMLENICNMLSDNPMPPIANDTRFTFWVSHRIVIWSRKDFFVFKNVKMWKYNRERWKRRADDTLMNYTLEQARDRVSAVYLVQKKHKSKSWTCCKVKSSLNIKSVLTSASLLNSIYDFNQFNHYKLTSSLSRK